MAELGGGHARALAEKAREIGGVVHADGDGHLADGHVAVLEQGLGPVDPGDLHPVHGAVAGLGADELVQVAGRDAQALRIARDGIQDLVPVEKQLEEAVHEGMGRGLAGRRNRIEEQVECAGEIAHVSPGERRDHPVHDLGDESGAVKPVGAHDWLSTGQERVGNVPEGRQEKTACIALKIRIMMDGKGNVRRYEQQLTAPAQARLAVDVGKHLSLQQEQEREVWQGGSRNLRRFDGELGLHTHDEKPMLGPFAPSFPIGNDSFHNCCAVSQCKYNKKPGRLSSG